MVRVILLLIAASFPSLAIAGSITLTFNNGGANLTKTVTPSDAEVTRIISSYKPLCTQASSTPCSNSQTFDWLATGLFQGYRDITQKSEQDAAAKTAKDAILPIGGIP